MKLDVDFPAWCFTDMIRDDTLSRVAAEFPDPDDKRWHTFTGPHEPRKQQGGPTCWGPATTNLIFNLLSPGTCAWVANLVGSQVLVGDITGGGMHQSGPGAHLDVHVDFDRHPDTGWRRAVNLLLFLNRGWQSSWGGALELHGEATQPLTITPEFGRLVIFRCSDRSWHGHPTQVADGHIRRSVAVYYYDPLDLPEGHGHSTMWRDDAGY